MNHSRARRFSSLAGAILLVLAALPAAAQSAPATTFWFAGTRLIFDSPVALAGDVAVSIRDSGLARLLARAGATIAYAPQQRYVVITAADHRLITFTIGDTRYSAGSATTTAPFAPFYDGNDVIVPLYTIARALSIEPVTAGSETVFEPQLGSLDVRPDGRRTVVTLHAATALRYAKTSDTPDKLVLTFSGIGSALTERRRVSGNVDEVDIAVTGSPKNPTATVTLIAARRRAARDRDAADAVRHQHRVRTARRRARRFKCDCRPRAARAAADANRAARRRCNAVRDCIGAAEWRAH